MRTRDVAFYTVAAWFLVAASFAQVLPDSVQLAAWQAFNQRNEGNWVVRWDEKTGVPVIMYGKKTIRYPFLTDGELIARQFLSDNRLIFKMKVDLSDLTLLRKLETRGAVVIDFQQTYNGIPVFGGEYTVSVGKDQGVGMVAGKYYSAVTGSVIPALRALEAINIVLAKLRIVPSYEPSSKLVIYPNEDRYVLAYLIGIDRWEVLVNAMDGRIEFQYERVLHVDGIGNAYYRDPVNSSLTQVPLPRLMGAGTTLAGTYVRATNAELGDAVNGSSDFRYTPPEYTQHDGTHFDDANVYYHVDRFAYDYWPAVGFPGIGRQIQATVHTDEAGPCGFMGHDNAVFCPGDGNLYFGHGQTLFWDLAKKEDVSYHEYTHAVSYSIGLGIGPYFSEQRALHEGYSDYHAATFTSNGEIGEWLTRDYVNLRTLSTSPSEFNYSNINSVTYPNNGQGLPYAASMIWSGALWDLRNTLGPTVTDFLVYVGLTNVHFSGLTFLDAREGIIAADQQWYGGAHNYTIRHTFYLRGIGSDGILPLSVSISGPSEVWHADPKGQPANCETWTANVTGGVPPYSYAWSGGYGSGTNSTYNECFSWNGYGGGSYQFTLRVDVTDAQSSTAFATKTVTAYNSGEPIEPIAAPGSDLQLVRVPQEYSLGQNYPNPFNPETQVSYALPEPSDVTITISDLLGREIVTLVHSHVGQGYHVARWNGTDNVGNKVGSGIYFYRVSAVGESGKRFTKVMKMLLAK